MTPDFRRFGDAPTNVPAEPANAAQAFNKE